ncbi:MAG: hypothetical protein ACKPKO_29205, partial [Candidatus Fonsibacter sp.]
MAVNSADFSVDTHNGSLMIIIPSEQAHAILLQVADDVRRGAKNHTQWMFLLSSVPVYIDVIQMDSQPRWEAP